MHRLYQFCTMHNFHIANFLSFAYEKLIEEIFSLKVDRHNHPQV